jgi:hypothetical protein
VGGTGSDSCSMESFDICDVGHSGSPPRALVLFHILVTIGLYPE